METEFPVEITSKVVYRNLPHIQDSVKSCLSELVESYTLSDKSSAGSKFISYTFTAKFDSDEHIDKTCTALKSINGFMMMI